MGVKLGFQSSLLMKPRAWVPAARARQCRALAASTPLKIRLYSLYWRGLKVRFVRNSGWSRADGTGALFLPA